MGPPATLEQAWQDYCNTLYPCADSTSVAELRRTFFAGALVLEMLALRVASEKGLYPFPEQGKVRDFLGALAPLREELHAVTEKLAEDPNDGE